VEKAEQDLKQISENVLGIVSDVKVLENEEKAVQQIKENLADWIL
jgi:uncharacterized protein (UPF0147 family)